MARCPICGETAPEPASLCIPRLVGIAKRDKPCDYSQEGEARFADEIGPVKAALLGTVLSSPSPLAAEGKTEGEP